MVLEAIAERIESSSLSLPTKYARVVEQVYTADLKSAAFGIAGSSLASGTRHVGDFICQIESLQTTQMQ